MTNDRDLRIQSYSDKVGFVVRGDFAGEKIVECSFRLGDLMHSQKFTVTTAGASNRPIITSETNFVFEEGKRLQLDCEFRISDNEAYKAFFSHNGKPIATNDYAEVSPYRQHWEDEQRIFITLTIKQSQKTRDEGSYRCTKSDGFGKETYASVIVKITGGTTSTTYPRPTSSSDSPRPTASPYITLPVITSNFEDGQIKRSSGDSLMLECLVTGLPTPQLSWSKNNEEIDVNQSNTGVDDQQRFIISDENSRLTFASLSVEDSGIYVCRATNREGESYKIFEVDVSGEYKKFADLFVLLTCPFLSKMKMMKSTKASSFGS